MLSISSFNTSKAEVEVSAQYYTDVKLFCYKEVLNLFLEDLL